MRVVIVSGLSGSGKTVALHALEDEGFYCIDNLPVGLLAPLAEQMRNIAGSPIEDIAVGVDARSGVTDLVRFPEVITTLRGQNMTVETIFLRTDEDILLKRFGETRRRHPLARRGMPLVEAIEAERELLLPVINDADLVVDTTRTNVHQLASLIRERVRRADTGTLSLLVQSFGFKHGVPTDSDYVFDVRCLPNPHWEPRLNSLTGLDDEVAAWLHGHERVERMFDDIARFIDGWLPTIETGNRRYLTVSLGCTGGQHRSVYLVERLAAHYRPRFGSNVTVRHRELS